MTAFILLCFLAVALAVVLLVFAIIYLDFWSIVATITLTALPLIAALFALGGVLCSAVLTPTFLGAIVFALVAEIVRKDSIR